MTSDTKEEGGEEPATSPVHPTFAQILAHLIDLRGHTLFSLAKVSGITLQGLSYLVDGTVENPSWHTVQLLALALEVPIAVFRDKGLRLPPSQPRRQRGRPRNQY